MPSNLNAGLFFLGALIGCATAVAGGVLEYAVSLRHADVPERKSPGCMLYTVGGLALTGVVALAASLVLTGGFRAALIMGAGVFAAFYLTFLLLFTLWMLIERRRMHDPLAASPAVPPASNPSSSSTTPQ